jgi:tagatose 6-phosphate kinase
MSGSLPAGVNRSFYARLIRACRGTFTILDTSGEPLAAGARAAPSLIRVNRDEARRLKAWKGPLVVSMGRDGAVARVDGRRARIRVPRLDAVNPVGAGDCMAAGIAAAIDAGRPLEEALALGAACGAASVLTPVTAGVRRRDVQRILKQVRIQWR